MLKKNRVEVYVIKGLDETLFIICDLSEEIFIKSNHSLLMINWAEDEVVIVFESFPLRKGKVHIVRCADQIQDLIVWTVITVLLESISCHNGSRLIFSFPLF